MSNEQKKVTQVVGTVKRYGTELLVPEDMPLKDAKKVIELTMEREETIVQKMFFSGCDPVEMAYAAAKAIDKVCGVVLGKTVETFFGIQRPQFLQVELSPTESISVPIGDIIFPFDPGNGSLNIGAYKNQQGQWEGVLKGQFAGKFTDVWEKIVAETRRVLAEEPLYRGRCLRIRFLNSDGDPLSQLSIKAWDVQNASTTKLIFSQELEEQIEDHIFTPIRYRDACTEAGIPFKRGILLAGDYGTGKTELAATVAAEAASRGITVVYIEDVKELPHAIRFAASQAPAIVFAEDIDREMGGERTHKMDVLLNTLDGIDTKRFPVMTILTTNYQKNLYKGLVRPGRIDVALEISPPDGGAAVRLVKLFLGDQLNLQGDFHTVGHELAGKIPAVIHEVCRRSVLSYISRTGMAPTDASITSTDVLRAAGSMANQIKLLNDRVPTVALGHGTYVEAQVAPQH